MRLKILCGMLLALTAHPALAKGAQWQESRQLFLANSGQRGEFTYSEDDHILRIPLVWEASARISAPVTFVFGNETETIAANSVLPEVIFKERGDESEGVRLYCTRSRVTEKVKSGGLVAILQSAITNSLSDSQKCLRDTDGDGAFDQTLMVGEGDNDFRAGSATDAVSYEVLENAPISNTADDVVTLEVYSVGKKKAKIWLSIVQNGKARRFDTVSSDGFAASSSTTIDFPAELNTDLQIFGATFQVIGFDPKAKTITVRWPENAIADRRLRIPTDKSYTF